MEINKYPDGTSYVTVKAGKVNSEFTYKLNSYEDLWHLNQTIDAIRDLTNKPLYVKIPNLLDAQADRRFAEGQSSGLKLVCNFLNSMKGVTWGIFHPHNPEVVEALIDDVDIVDNEEFIRETIWSICRTGALKYSKRDWDNNTSNLILMSSDAGGFKPLMKLCDKLNWKGQTASASKSRKYENGETKLTQIIGTDDFEGKDILIVDDISVYGGTFKGLATKLRERNVGKLYLAVSHMTMENLGKDPVTNYFDKVFTTNSKYDNYYAPDGQGGTQPRNLEIFKFF